MNRLRVLFGACLLGLSLPVAAQLTLPPLFPPTPPALPDAAAAERFLTQATFGPSKTDIQNLQTQGYDTWLNGQFSSSPTLHRPQLEGIAFSTTPATQADRQEVWWRAAITAPDQLRQRVAFALSEIFVVSDLNSQLNDQPLLLAEFYDTLLRDAFGNYRQLLEDVTLAPAMGLYLSHLRNNKPDAKTGRRPDENYAREAMQLFSIGLFQLKLDGSAKLDGSGQPIPTYSQDTIENFARLYTGWTWADAKTFYASGTSYAPMKAFEANHDTDAKTLLDGRSVPAGQTAAQDLKAGLDDLFNHPNVAPFICRRLIQRLVTSNPSPAYLQRVAQVFENNGSGVRGDLKAVVRAVLMDNEARATPSGHFGKLREPLLRLTAVWRAFQAASANGKYPYPNAERDWGQAALRSPSVFNFFTPDYAAPGEISKAGLSSPEFALQTESQSLTMVNAFTRFIRSQYQGGSSKDSTAVLLNIDDEKALASKPDDLVERLNHKLLYGQMASDLRSALVSYLNSVPLGDGSRRATDAIFLIATAPDFAVQK